MNQDAERIRRCLEWLRHYNAELDAQAISPNGDDFNRICDAVGSILSGGNPPDIRITPAGR